MQRTIKEGRPRAFQQGVASVQGQDYTLRHNTSQDDMSLSLSSRPFTTIRHGLRDGTGTQQDQELPSSHDGRRTVTSEFRDLNLVTWNTPEDIRNPKQWSSRKKWVTVFCVSCFGILSPVTSSMVAPALTNIGHDLSTTDPVDHTLILSIFVLAYAFGPLVWGPLSEVYGRCRLIHVSNMMYISFNLRCGLSSTKTQMIAFRFLAGFGGSAPLAIGGAVISDLFIPAMLGQAIGIFTLAPLLGPAIGPIAGGFISQVTSWRWLFHSTTILAATIQSVGFFVLSETYAPVILRTLKKHLIEETGNTSLRTVYDNPDKTWFLHMGTNLTRPLRLLSTHVLVQFIALYMMYLYGVLYLVLSTYARLWTIDYRQRVGIAGLNYISIGLGFLLGAQLCAPL
ncbi:major facilitator superfamily transporter [Paramyrothecium foliicola]|nr:major facilitator superfamily transporter [Paramyrothecium foliicola]